MRKSNSSVNHASAIITINKKIQEDSITVQNGKKQKNKKTNSFLTYNIILLNKLCATDKKGGPS